MASDEKQRLAFEYLVGKFHDQQVFEKADFQKATSWTDSTFETYWTKQFRQFFVQVRPGKDRKLRVSESFRPYLSWERFQKHVTQVRQVSSDYTSLVHENIIVFEFFMPLANEEHLRTSLDSLFYKDEVVRRLRTVEGSRLAKYFPRGSSVSDEQHLNGVADWIGSRFGGYSISHVNGRFRAGPIVTLAAAAGIQEKGGRYLIDETTAIVRFIFPCGKAIRRDPPLSAETFEEVVVDESPEADAVAAEAAKIRWAFGVLFVQSIVQVVNGEAQIWMMESGMRSRLHIWLVESAEG